MNGMIADLTLEYLNNTKTGAAILKILPVFQQAQETLLSYLEDTSPDHQKQIRMGTVLTLLILGKLASGKKIEDFQIEDWQDVASRAAEYAIKIDPQQYSISIFSLYAQYVDASADYLRMLHVSEGKCDAIRNIACIVREAGEQLKRGEISETAYTEKCLWQLLEAMIKLLAAFGSVFLPKDAADFVQSRSAFAFEYGRYTLYKREQELLEEYIAHQYEVDDELNQKFAEFQEALKLRQDEFMSLVSDAFDPDIMTRFRSTVEIAESAGVDESEILDSVEKIDDFFT
ncbi:MAG: hypothetical protein IJK38_06540 [Oscillospiraceae bacterium]|nr:hypothetical protein [Oscillospiraceae bacterium]